MPRGPDVGISDRTPYKHELINSLLGFEVWGINRAALVSDTPGGFWVDLTAGDGVAAPNDNKRRQAWHHRCSPGLLAHHARWGQNRKPIRIVLHEMSPRTYATLLENLSQELPALGYSKYSDSAWLLVDRGVTIEVRNQDGREFDPAEVPPGWAVHVLNDPNKMTNWAMHPYLMQTVRGRTVWCLGVSTMGCNVSGLKAWTSSEDRNEWYQYVGQQIQSLPNHHDLLLAKIENDASQWAYLVISPVKHRDRVEDAAVKAFSSGGYSLQRSWYKLDPPGFQDICDVLFKTNGERSA